MRTPIAFPFSRRNSSRRAAGRVEVDEADRPAGDAEDGQAGPVAVALDEPAFLHVEVERVGEDTDGVEADLLRHADAVGGLPAGLGPRRVNQSELHGVDL